MEYQDWSDEYFEEYDEAETEDYSWMYQLEHQCPKCGSVHVEQPIPDEAFMICLVCDCSWQI